MKRQISPSSSCCWWRGGAMRQKDTSTGRRGQKRWGGGSHSVSFELMSPCWAGFDIQTMRQGSTQGGRLPCNINSHLESSCGCGHETLKETAAMDPVPSRRRSRGPLQLPPHCSPKPAQRRHKRALLPRLGRRRHLAEGECFQGPSCVAVW